VTERLVQVPVAHLLVERIVGGLNDPKKSAAFAKLVLEYGMRRPKTPTEARTSDRQQSPRMIFLNLPHDPLDKASLPAMGGLEPIAAVGMRRRAMTIPRIIVLLMVALVVTGCATGYGEHQAALAAFNDDVVRWNADFGWLQAQFKAMESHPGRTVEPRLSEAMARATARGATTIRAMVDAATEELAPQRASMRPDEVEYALAMRRLAYSVADLADQREQIERRRQQLTQQAFDVAAAEQRQAFWSQMVLGVLAAQGGGGVVVAPSSSPPVALPAGAIQPAVAR